MNEKEELLHIAFDRLSEKYPDGLYEWLYKHRPQAYREIAELEDNVNTNFLCSGSVEELKAILRAYWIIHMRSIREFKENSQPDGSFNEVRAERITELETLHP